MTPKRKATAAELRAQAKEMRRRGRRLWPSSIGRLWARLARVYETEAEVLEAKAAASAKTKKDKAGTPAGTKDQE
jgi:hypothetical protein